MSATTVDDMIAFLQQFDGDVEVRVIQADDGNCGVSQAEAFNPQRLGNWEYMDFINNRFVQNDPTHPGYGRRILVLGEIAES